MKKKLAKIISEIQDYATESDATELQVLENLNDYYYKKNLNDNLKLYKKGKKKVRDITKDLKMSPRKFYAILEKKKIKHVKYKKSDLK